MAGTARAWAVTGLVSGSIGVAAVMVWQLRVLLVLVLLAFTLSAGMRNTVDALTRRGVPLAVAILLHYAVFLLVIGIAIAVALPTALHQIDTALGGLPPDPDKLGRAARHADGREADLLRALARAIRRAPTRADLLHPALDATRALLAVLAAVAFTFATAAYWMTERDRALHFLGNLVPASKRPAVLATWAEVEARLGGYVRRVFLTMVVVSVVLSAGYWLIGVPYSLLLGLFSGVVEIIPVVGPFIAGAAAILLALTVSWQLALAAGGLFLGFRLAQDYLINPRLSGGGVGVPPMIILLAAAAVGLLFGPAAAVVATPLAAITVTLFEVVVRGRPAERTDEILTAEPSTD